MKTKFRRHHPFDSPVASSLISAPVMESSLGCGKILRNSDMRLIANDFPTESTFSAV